jgi:predicted lipid-binding transport protein (Tim44 family)
MRMAAKMTVVLAVLALVAMAIPETVWARAGGGVSSGSRGSRSFSSPSSSYRAPSTSPSSPPITQPTPAPVPEPMAQPAPAGGFMRSMAGGMVGGFLGGMLFRSFGFAGGAFGGSGGGFGLFDLLLLAGIAYLIYCMVRRSRVAREEATAGGYERSVVESSSAPAPGGAAEAPQDSRVEDMARGLTHVRQMDPSFDEAAFREVCTDRFFQIQAAWMRRDLDKLRPLLTGEMVESFGKQIETARAKRQVNKLENITIRSVELTEVWQEQGNDYATVRLLANLLDYTVDEATSRVVDGSDTAPVKFEEYWTWVRPVGPNPWRLSAINQAE